MGTNIIAMVTSDKQMDCFGDYDKNNPLCAKHCALRLGCVIAQDRNMRTEILEELVAYDSSLSRIQ